MLLNLSICWNFSKIFYYYYNRETNHLNQRCHLTTCGNSLQTAIPYLQNVHVTRAIHVSVDINIYIQCFGCIPLINRAKQIISTIYFDILLIEIYYEQSYDIDLMFVCMCTVYVWIWMCIEVLVNISYIFFTDK